MAFASKNCLILLLPPELVRNLCSYLTPDAVCQLEKACSKLQNTMNQQIIWKKQVESFPVAGIPFGDSSEATYSKCSQRFDYFNKRLLNFFIEEPEWFGWDNPHRVALRVKFTIDKLLGDVKHFVENDSDEALGKLKEDANLNPDRDWLYRYPLKIWQVKVELDQSDKWNFECRDYLLKWMVHGQIIPDRKRIDWEISNDKNVSQRARMAYSPLCVFKIESYMYHDNLMKDESDSENENDSSDDENHGSGDGEEEVGVEGFDDSDVTEEEEGAEDSES